MSSEKRRSIVRDSSGRNERQARGPSLWRSGEGRPRSLWSRHGRAGGSVVVKRSVANRPPRRGLDSGTARRGGRRETWRWAEDEDERMQPGLGPRGRVEQEGRAGRSGPSGRTFASDLENRASGSGPLRGVHCPLLKAPGAVDSQAPCVSRFPSAAGAPGKRSGLTKTFQSKAGRPRNDGKVRCMGRFPFTRQPLRKTRAPNVSAAQPPGPLPRKVPL